jgi:hypothetical protein
MKKQFVHSTTPDGLLELLARENDAMDDGTYLSVSTAEGSTKYIEKGSQTVYVRLEADEEDVLFSEWGDVGWHGGTPQKTTYDETGLTKYHVLGLFVPGYLKDDLNTTGRTLVAEIYAQDESPECNLKIEIKNDDLREQAENMIDSVSCEDLGTWYEEALQLF